MRLGREIRKVSKDLVVPENSSIFAAKMVVFDIVISETYVLRQRQERHAL